MDVREKLVELLSYFADGYSIENRHIVDGTKVCDIADHLIAHGVTVEMKTIHKPDKPISLEIMDFIDWFSVEEPNEYEKGIAAGLRIAEAIAEVIEQNCEESSV